MSDPDEFAEKLRERNHASADALYTRLARMLAKQSVLESALGDSEEALQEHERNLEWERRHQAQLMEEALEAARAMKGEKP